MCYSCHNRPLVETLYANWFHQIFETSTMAMKYRPEKLFIYLCLIINMWVYITSILEGKKRKRKMELSQICCSAPQHNILVHYFLYMLYLTRKFTSARFTYETYHLVISFLLEFPMWQPYCFVCQLYPWKLLDKSRAMKSMS